MSHPSRFLLQNHWLLRAISRRSVGCPIVCLVFDFFSLRLGKQPEAWLSGLQVQMCLIPHIAPVRGFPHRVTLDMSFDPVDYDRALANVQDGHGREEFAPTSEQKLGRFTIVSLHLNRSIGSGIFVTPALILKGTGSVGASLLLWAAGAVISTFGLLVWLELGLSVPRQRIRDGSKKSVPRSGGRKTMYGCPLLTIG